MIATMISAAESTGNVNTSQHVRDVADRLAELDPEAGPIALITRQLDKRVADNFRAEWPEKELPPRYDQINNGAGYASGVTTWAVDNATYFRIADLVKVPRTGEVVRVTAVGSTTIDIVRGVGSTSAAAVVDNDDLFIIGSAHAEGADVPTEKEMQETWKYNFTQIFRDSFGATRTQQNTRSYLGNNRTRQRREQGVKHKVNIEQGFLFGERNEDVSTPGAPRRYTGGVLYWATSNIKDAGGTLTEGEVWNWCEGLFQPTGTGNTRTLFASPLVCTVIDLLAASRLQTVPRDRTYGIAVKEWVTSHGTLLIIKHRLLVTGVGGQGYGGMAIALDMPQLAYRYLANSDTKLLPDRQGNGADKWTDEYLSEIGLEFKLPPVHGVLKNVTG